MKLNSILRRICVPAKRALADLEKVTQVDEDTITAAMQLEALLELINRRTAMPPAKVRAFTEFVEAQPKKERVRLKPKDFTPKKPKKEVVIRPEPEPFGRYGEWDHPNEAWARAPTVEDIPAIMEQKQKRSKSGLWRSEELMLDWFKAKGWL